MKSELLERLKKGIYDPIINVDPWFSKVLEEEKESEEEDGEEVEEDEEGEEDLENEFVEEESDIEDCTHFILDL